MEAGVVPQDIDVAEVGEGGDVKIDVSPMLLRRQMTLIASWTFSNIIQAECATFCVERKIDVDALFTHRWKLDQAEVAYKLFDHQSDGKGVFLKSITSITLTSLLSCLLICAST